MQPNSNASLQTKLGAVKLALKGLLSEVEAIEQELQRETNQELALPPEEWLPLAEVAKRFGYGSLRACKAWAVRNGIEFKALSRGKIFFHRDELNTKIKAAPTPEGKPVVKSVPKKHNEPDPDQAAASRAVIRLMNKKRV